MKRWSALLVLIALLASVRPTEARHKPHRVRACHLYGIGITYGGDTGEPDLYHYAYRCSDGTRYEIASHVAP